MIEIKFDKDNKQAIAYDNNVKIGECNYIESEDCWNIIHTKVSDLYQGQGIARKLVENIIENAQKYEKNIIANCSYAKKVIDKIGGKKMKQKFLKCEHCGNIVGVVKESGVPVMCCGEEMKEIIPGTVEASKEKHIPVYKVEGNKVYVNVGDIEHPMQEEHYIEWISIQTKFGNQRKVLKPNNKPEVCFSICEGDEIEAVFAYCNLHGLWKAE